MIVPGGSHDEFETDIATQMAEMGFLTGSLTYHGGALPKAVAERLSKVTTPTALYVRTRSDRFAIHEQRPICFLWEAKGASPKYQNLAIEAYPFLQHLFQAQFNDVDCLYVVQRPDGSARAFWVSDHPQIRLLRLTLRQLREPSVSTWIRERAESLIREARIVDDRRPTAGSDDPFLLIDSAVADSLPYWQQLVSALLQP